MAAFTRRNIDENRERDDSIDADIAGCARRQLCEREAVDAEV
jgi:hypothetical protein